MNVRLALTVIIVLIVTRFVACANPGVKPTSDVPNVVFVVGDGFGLDAYSLARAWAAHLPRQLVLDEAPVVGFLEPHCSNEFVTDSAAAATAWSTGSHAIAKTVGHGASGNRPLLFERLRDHGFACGLVTTTRVTHATPAAFYARVDNRNDENAIADQLVAFAPDVAIGGGSRHFERESEGGKRSDGRNLLVEAESKGTYVSRELVADLPEDRASLILLSPSHMDHELDRKRQPDLSTMVVRAIDRLKATEKPWFLLVEEGRIDHAGHDMDAPSIAANTVRLDRAVASVLEATDSENTLVVVLADHATGRPSLLEFARPDSFAVVTASIERMEGRIFQGKGWAGTPRALEGQVLPVIDRHARHTGLSSRDLDRLITAKNVYERRAALGKAVSRRFGIGFLPYEDYLSSTNVHGHTGELVPVRAWGPGSEGFLGIHDHADVGRMLVELLDLE